MPLSWSVATVCSLRPSEPKASQQPCFRSMRWAAATIVTRCSVSTSFKWLISSVSWRAPTPWPSRLRAKRRMSCDTTRSVATSGAARIAVLTCFSDKRCSANRSRSDRMPTTRPLASATGTWRMPYRDIASAASCAVWSMPTVTTGRLITSPIGVDNGFSASVTRPRMSWRVRMPSAAPLSSATTSTEPMRFSCIDFNATPSGVDGATPTAARRSRSRSGVSSDCSASVCEA